MKIALCAAEPAEIVRAFLSRHAGALGACGIEVAVVVIDENSSKLRDPLRHSLNIARRQAKAAGCSAMMGFFKIVAFKAVTRLTGGADELPVPEMPISIKTVRVGTLNSDAAIEALNSSGAELICLMGTRILTKRTLRALGKPAINIHTSDPRFMRGSPSVVWEVLAGYPEITLTIHKVTEQLDAGEILVQAKHVVVYGGGLGRTISRTMTTALPRIADVFFEAITGLARGTLAPTRFEPGPLRVTPKVSQTLKAEFLCRLRGSKSSFEAQPERSK